MSSATLAPVRAELVEAPGRISPPFDKLRAIGTASSGRTALRDATTEPLWVQRLLIGVALAFMTLFLFVPLATVFVEAFKKGVAVYLAAITEPDALSAIKLT